MRLLTRSKIWRAFPELDEFDDEQCAAFVRRAQNRYVNQVHFRTIVLLITFVFVVIGFNLFITILSIIDAFGLSVAVLGPKVEIIVAVLFVAAAPTICSLLVRDFLLRRRIASLIRKHGLCGGCGYSLLGLRLDEGHSITCPECGIAKRVDGSLALRQHTRHDNPNLTPSPPVANHG